MNNKPFERVSSAYCILRHGKYLVFYGRRLIIYQMDGTLIACKKELHHVYKIAFLSGDRVIIDCGTQHAYIVLSLVDGSELWRVPYPKLEYTCGPFRVSKDEHFVYDYYPYKGHRYIARIDLITQKISSFKLKKGLRAVSDIYLDDDGVLFLSEHHYETIEGKYCSINAVRYIDPEDSDPWNTVIWQDEWLWEHPLISQLFWKDSNSILTNNLNVYDIRSKTTYPIEPIARNPKKPHRQLPRVIFFTPDGKYATIVMEGKDIIVDTETFTMVARYATDDHHGCLIDDEYWVVLDGVVQRKPFPLIEEIPEPKYVFWKPYLK